MNSSKVARMSFNHDLNLQLKMNYLIYRSRNLAHNCSYYLQGFIFTYGQKMKNNVSFKTRNLFFLNLSKNTIILHK